MGAGCSASKTIIQTYYGATLPLPSAFGTGSSYAASAANAPPPMSIAQLALLTPIEEAAEVKRGTGLPRIVDPRASVIGATVGGGINGVAGTHGTTGGANAANANANGVGATAETGAVSRIGGYTNDDAAGGGGGGGAGAASVLGSIAPNAAASIAAAGGGGGGQAAALEKNFEQDMYETLFWNNASKTYNILLVGLRGSGKTSLVSVVKSREAKGKYILPLCGPSRSIVKHPITLHSRRCCLIDTPGGIEARADLERLCSIPVAQSPLPLSRIVWVIDSTDVHGINAARSVVESLCSLPGAMDAPLLLVLNKQDLPSSLSASQLLPFLQLHTFVHPVIQVQEVSLTDPSQIASLIEGLLQIQQKSRGSKGARKHHHAAHASIGGGLNLNSAAAAAAGGWNNLHANAAATAAAATGMAGAHHTARGSFIGSQMSRTLHPANAMGGGGGGGGGAPTTPQHSKQPAGAATYNERDSLVGAGALLPAGVARGVHNRSSQSDMPATASSPAVAGGDKQPVAANG